MCNVIAVKIQHGSWISTAMPGTIHSDKLSNKLQISNAILWIPRHFVADRVLCKPISWKAAAEATRNCFLQLFALTNISRKPPDKESQQKQTKSDKDTKAELTAFEKHKGSFIKSNKWGKGFS